MTNRRKTIGRTMESISMLADARDGVDFTLRDGRIVRFTKITISAEDVETLTCVNEDINFRDQSALTSESLEDIIITFRLTQFYPAIGVAMDDGRYEVLDGSRRRKSAILSHRPLDMLVTTDELTEREARDLSRDIQTAREHSLREVGKRYLKLQTGGMSQSEIAEAERVSQGTVSKAIAAATICEEVATLFDDINALSNRNYQFLADVDAAFLRASDDQKRNLCERIKELRERPEHSEKSAEERKDAIIRELKNWLEDHQAQAPSKEVREDLIRPRRGMRAVVKKTKHSVVFHLTKLPDETTAVIEAFIRETLTKLGQK